MSFNQKPEQKQVRGARTEVSRCREEPGEVGELFLPGARDLAEGAVSKANISPKRLPDSLAKAQLKNASENVKATTLVVLFRTGNK